MTPLEPLYSLKVAAELIPFVHVGALRDFLWKHRDQFPARVMPIARRRCRMLTADELVTIRSMRVKYRLRTPEGRQVGR